MPQQTYYYKFPDGSVSVRNVEFDGDVIVDPQPPAGAVVISALVYRVLLAELEQTTEDLLSVLRAAGQQQAAEDFAALTAVGIAPLTARRLTGFLADAPATQAVDAFASRPQG